MPKTPKKTETFGVNIINDLCEHDYLSCNVSQNDKTPATDGFIEVYTTDSLEKKDFFDRITIQIKSERSTTQYNKKECMFKITREDINYYRNSLGIIFFVCIADDENKFEKKLFYKYLFPKDLDEIEKTMKNTSPKSTKKIHLTELASKTSEEFYKIIYEFAKKHKNLTNSIKVSEISLNDVKNPEIFKNLKIKTIYNKIDNKFTFEDIDFIGVTKDEFGNIYKVKNDIASFDIISDELEILIDNEKYGKCKLIHDIISNKQTFQISENLKLENNVLKFEINANSTLFNILNEVNIITKLICGKTLHIGKYQYTFNCSKKQKEIYKLKLAIEKMFKICEKINLDKKILLFDFLDKDYFLLKNLKELMNKKHSKILTLNISNKNITFFMSDDMVETFFSNETEIIIKNDEKEYYSPKLTLVPYGLLKNLYICEKFIEQSIDEIKQETIKDNFNLFNIMLLNLIDFSDTNNGLILDNALYLSKYIEENTIDENNKLINKINKYQILYRQNNLTKFEKDDLNKIIKNETLDADFKFCIYCLLGDKINADIYLQKIDKSLQEDFKDNLPIAKIYKNLMQKD